MRIKREKEKKRANQEPFPSLSLLLFWCRTRAERLLAWLPRSDQHCVDAFPCPAGSLGHVTSQWWLAAASSAMGRMERMQTVEWKELHCLHVSDRY